MSDAMQAFDWLTIDLLVAVANRALFTNLLPNHIMNCLMNFAVDGLILLLHVCNLFSICQSNHYNIAMLRPQCNTGFDCNYIC